MSVSIKLARFGSRNAPFYRVVAQTTRSKVNGRSLDVIGWWDPKHDKKEVDKKKLEEWVKKGAILTSAVKILIGEETKKQKTKDKNKKAKK